MRNKMQAKDDHRFARRPRPSRNVDVNRTLCVVEDEHAMKELCRRCSEAFGIVKVKNGFDLSPEEAFDIFELRVVMLTLRYDAKRTYGELASDVDVQRLWLQYENDEAERGIPVTRWRKHVDAALAFLRSPEIRNERVVTMAEVQAILKPYYEVRQEMHELYKAFRAENPTQLLADFERCFPKSFYAKRAEADNLWEAAEYDQANNILCRIAGADFDNIDMPDNRGYTPLLIGAENGHVDVVRVLAEAGSKSLDTPQKPGENTPLLWCAQRGFADIAKILVDAGATSLDTPNKNGITPLLWCAQEGFADVAKVLVDAGAQSLDTPDDNNTPLMWCADLGFEGVAQVLVEGGAKSIDEKRADGFTPLLLCAEGGFLDVALVLVHGGADLQAAVKSAQKEGNASQIAFLERLQDIAQSGKSWYT